jgi:hypothetical protein
VSFPDYGAAVEQVGDLIATAAKLKKGVTLHLEPDLPPGPDALESVYEVGGTWIRDRCVQQWNLQLITRAATLKEARALLIATIKGVDEQFLKLPRPTSTGIIDLKLSGLPRLVGRDARNRVILETPFVMSLRAEPDIGL